MNPPARSASVTRGANGSAIASSTAHAMTISQRRRTTKRPRAANGPPSGPAVLGGGVDIAGECYRQPALRAAVGLWYDPSDGSSLTRTYVQLFTIFFSRPVEFGLATAMTVLMLVILVRAMFSAEKQTSLSRFVTKPSSRWLFAGLFLLWALVFGIGLQLVPHEGANSPYGGLGLIAMFTGLFIMMGFVWAVIGE